MADAEDLKSSGDFSSWGFDSPPGHHLFQFKVSSTGLSLCRHSVRRRLKPVPNVENRIFALPVRSKAGVGLRGSAD